MLRVPYAVGRLVSVHLLECHAKWRVVKKVVTRQRHILQAGTLVVGPIGWQQFRVDPRFAIAVAAFGLVSRMLFVPELLVLGQGDGHALDVCPIPIHHQWPTCKIGIECRLRVQIPETVQHTIMR